MRIFEKFFEGFAQFEKIFLPLRGNPFFVLGTKKLTGYSNWGAVYEEQCSVFDLQKQLEHGIKLS